MSPEGGREDGADRRWAAMSGGEPNRSEAAPPGWRADPRGRFEQRFHDGTGWTPRVRLGDAVAIDTRRDATAEDDWYPDPTGRFERRAFVDGRWTKRVRVGTAVAIDTTGVKADRRAPRGAPRTASTASDRAPGWYPDPRPRTEDGRDWWDPRPDLRERERYWDGYQWTAKLRRPGGRRERAPARIFMSRALVILVGIVVVLLAALILWVVLG